jgi:hypothetical protein
MAERGEPFGWAAENRDCFGWNVTVAGRSSLMKDPSESSATRAWISARVRRCSPLEDRVAPET